LQNPGLKLPTRKALAGRILNKIIKNLLRMQLATKSKIEVNIMSAEVVAMF